MKNEIVEKGKMVDVSNRIKRILSSISGIPQKDILDILEFLENDEWGVAFEVLCSVIEQDNLSINAEQYQGIEEIGVKMDMDVTMWCGIKPKI